MPINFIHSSMIVFSGLIFGKILAMLNSIILARYLSLSNFGLFLLGLSLFQFFMIPCHLGIPSILPKLVSEYITTRQSEKVSKALSLSLGSCTFLSVVFAISAFSLAPFVSEHIFQKPELQIVLRALSLILPFSVSIPVILSVYRGYKITRAKVLYGDVLPYLLRIPVFLIFFYSGFRLPAAYYAFIVSALIIFTLIKSDIKRTLKIKIKLNFYDSELSPTLFKLSWPLMLQSFVWVIYTRMDRIFIGYYLSSEDVGVYGVAAAIAGLLSMIPQSFSFLSLPVFSKFVVEKSFVHLRTTYQKITTIMFVITLPIFISFVFLSKDILTLLYGSDYSSGGTALLIISGGVLSRCLIGPASDALIGAGKTKAPLISLATGCLSNIFLNILLIPRYGINGAAVATCSSMLISRVIIAWFNYRYLKIIPISGSYFIWLIICVLIVPVFILQDKASSGYLFLDVSLSGMVYLLVNYLILFFVIKFTVFGKKWLSDFNLLISS